ncbi:hypothetical protein A3731_22505 [Roseovarius sp. HI0049]|nr:hypothetical protein A3731_22505 [Roseovarius sp. HI0049]
MTIQTKTTRVLAFLLALVLTGAMTGGAQAKPAVKEKWGAYRVDATDANGILSQMKQRGPNGYWAYTSWYVRWTGNCQVSVEINYTMPQHVNENALPANLRNRWKSMVRALAAHERKHGQHGINAANEIAAGNCRNGDAIIKKWSNADKALDKRTTHGKSEGVVFP